ncbi:MAG: hypothetical protein HRU15_02650 [Planctomycetes bacterium]|nr:hypothetical protein [Planctomycetota bacterium]
MPNKPSINPNALTPEQCMLILQKSGSPKASVAHIQRDIENGAPVNADGTIHMMHYCAWLTQMNLQGNAYGS